ncbi:MAG: 2-amino-4-hydroxy-6-hydroxymethyldihydropteridine diphosphokinase [Helicobacter trogontum]|uniref:2-amino-4-hydroxy-6- hydroxymethyldihydropteridine diphosphokinase n=1 Tax=Helicobacter trogontum TaxID=50960 RepID=UPI00243147CC|nr:2-amino-4-hydroxy-6-hydroxymethyldihydropteridine diphosphokinase [Helicobacter trogontum]MCI5786240.1 2-amino-4-hydroxy-6-hydroxymethyldihydropteridine diphosphokinase [Helicobacter trogontum]
MKLFTKHFPYVQRGCKSYANMVVWGVGANVGHCIQTFEQLFSCLHRHPKIQIHSTAYIYKNPPFGYKMQPDFYNTSIVFSTSLCVRSLFSLMFYFERKFGRERVRLMKNGERSLDIDLIFYARKKANLAHMYLPHRDYANRQSVLQPLTFQLGLFK